jgi:TonB family protein
VAGASALLLASMGAPLNAGTWFTGAVEGPRRLAGAATELSADAATALLAAAGIRAAAPEPPAADPDPEPPVASTPRSRRLAPVTADGSESGVSASSPIAARTPVASWIAAPIDGRNRLLEGNGRTMIAEADEALEAISQRVFTVWDSDVEPPVLMHPALPSSPPPGMHLDEVGVVEVTVGPTGDVEGIRLLSAATRYQERMILSAIKAWQFEPATKEGTPVRYRLRVRVTL